MASVRLGRYEVEDYDLPGVCMRCGARATVYKRNRFKWYPPWAFLVMGAIGAMIFTKALTLPVPLCDKHKSHCSGRAAVVGFSLPLIPIFWPIFWIAFAVVASQFKTGPELVFIPAGVLFLAWLVVAVVLLSIAGIRPTEITDTGITLGGVSEEFIRALEADRRGDDEKDDRHGRPRAKRRDRGAEDDGGYYDPDRRRRRGRHDEDER